MPATTAVKFDAGHTDVPAAGTPVALSSDAGLDAEARIVWGRFRNLDANTGLVYVGITGMSATDGWTLYKPAAGADDEGLKLDIPTGYTVRLGDIFFDAATNGDDVEWAIMYQAH